MTGALVLAAGFSNRFGSVKLCAELPDGDTVFQRTLRQLCAAIPEVIVVTRPDLQPLLPATAAEVICFDDAEQGMGASLAFGIAHVIGQRDWQGCLVCLADMPYIRPDTYQALARRLTSHTIVVPRFRERLGNPAGFGRDYFGELAALSGDQGGRQVLRTHRAAVIEMEVDDAAVLYDIDTPEDLALAASQSG
jgi:molybdenum cofactor cytidylyltransferase